MAPGCPEPAHCPRYEFQARNPRIPGLKACRDLILCPLTVHKPGPETLWTADRRNGCGPAPSAEESCGATCPPTGHGDHQHTERPGAAAEHRGALGVPRRADQDALRLAPERQGTVCGPCRTTAPLLRQRRPGLAARAPRAGARPRARRAVIRRG